MKLQPFVVCFFLLPFFLFLAAFPPLATADNRDEKNRDTRNGEASNHLEILADATYSISPRDSREVVEALCLFSAKYKAVALGAKYLNHNGVLKAYGKMKKEIFCLVADRVAVEVIEQKMMDPARYYTRIRARVGLADFTRAEMADLGLEKQERQFSWQEEMEQYLYQTIAPGEEISRAYRYLRKKERRIGMIYLDHLQLKYPNWDEIYFAKAIGYYILNNREAMLDALKRSCQLGNAEACGDFKGLN